MIFQSYPWMSLRDSLPLSHIYLCLCLYLCLYLCVCLKKSLQIQLISLLLFPIHVNFYMNYLVSIYLEKKLHYWVHMYVFLYRHCKINCYRLIYISTTVIFVKETFISWGNIMWIWSFLKHFQDRIIQCQNTIKQAYNLTFQWFSSWIG